MLILQSNTLAKTPAHVNWQETQNVKNMEDLQQLAHAAVQNMQTWAPNPL